MESILLHSMVCVTTLSYITFFPDFLKLTFPESVMTFSNPQRFNHIPGAELLHKAGADGTVLLSREIELLFTIRSAFLSL